jgi:drug/metabolite transporter (DMT)-like permease
MTGADTASATRAGAVQLIAGSFLISFSAVFVKLAHIGPTAAGFYRNLFGGLVLLVVVFARRSHLWRGRRPMVYALMAGVFFGADIFCWHRSINCIGPGLATIMGNFQVFFMALVGVFVFKEKATWRFVVSIPLAVTGLFLLVGLEWSELDASYKQGVWLGLATALTYAAYLLTVRRSQRETVRLGAMANLAILSLVTATLLGVSNLVEGKSFRIVDTRTWVVLVAYGVVCQAAGWIIISRALRVVDASRAGLMLLLQPSLTFLWDILFFGRPTTAVEGFGAALALGAIYLGNTRSRKAVAEPAIVSTEDKL